MRALTLWKRKDVGNWENKTLSRKKKRTEHDRGFDMERRKNIGGKKVAKE